MNAFANNNKINGYDNNVKQLFALRLRRVFVIVVVSIVTHSRRGNCFLFVELKRLVIMSVN